MPDKSVIVGRTMGIAIASSLCALSFAMRLPRVIGIGTVLGWLCVAFTVCNIVVFSSYSREDYQQFPMARGWVMVARMLAGLLLFCAVLGAIHAFCYRIPWAQAYGVVMLEVGIAVGVGVLLQEKRDSMASFLPISPSERAIIGPNNPVRVMLGQMHLSLAWSLLLLELGMPFLIRYRLL